MSKSITIKKVKETLRNLRKLTPANPKIDDDLEISIKEAIAFMAPDLIRMTKRGFTVKELSAGLADDGFDIKPATLNRYLNEHLASKRDLGQSDSTPKNDGPKGNQQEQKSGGQPEKSSLASRHKDQSEQNPIEAEKNPNPPSENPNPGSAMRSTEPDFPVSRQSRATGQPPSASQW